MAYRVALVTGSTSGIGLGIARALASKGCSILMTGFGSETVIHKHQEELVRDFKVPVTYVGGDLSQQGGVEDLCRAVREKYPGGIDILVNNAGFQFTSPIHEFPVEKWNAMLSVMLTAPFMLTKNFLPDMKNKGWGRIVNVASVHGHVASLNKGAYVTAKHGMIGFTKVVALEQARSGVTCNAICPGWVATEIYQQQVEAIVEQEKKPVQEAKETLLEKMPTRECTTLEQVGQAVNYLCSSACDNMTGSSLFLDGGWTAQ